MRVVSSPAIRQTYSFCFGLGWCVAALSGCRSNTPPEPENLRREPAPEPEKAAPPAPLPAAVVRSRMSWQSTS